MTLTFIALIFVPILFCSIVFVLFRKTIVWQEALIMFLGTVIVISFIYHSGRYSQIHDTKIQTGEITEKVRVNSSHIEPYPCNCRTVCSGGKYRSCSSRCSTCWRTRYTVDWSVKSTLGNCGISGTDSLSPSVWNTPDPARYTSIKVGDPLHKDYSYSNYIKGAPDSILHLNPMIDKYEKLIPEYSEIYDIYRFNHVIQVGTSIINQDALNTSIENILKKYSPTNHFVVRCIILDEE